MVNLGNIWQYLAVQSPLQSHFNASEMAVKTYALPELAFQYNALEPYISAQIMELHHSKHHQTYVTNLNRALESHHAAILANDIAAQIALQPVIKFNGGGHINHALFWQNLAPESDEGAKPDAAPSLVAEITKRWGSVDKFKENFSSALLGIQGSGWGWLVKEEGEGAGALRIITTQNQDPVFSGEVPIIGVDMWEHAYYLQYLNGKASYVENIWNVINWKTAEQRFLAGRADVLKGLEL